MHAHRWAYTKLHVHYVNLCDSDACSRSFSWFYPLEKLTKIGCHSSHNIFWSWKRCDAFTDRIFIYLYPYLYNCHILIIYLLFISLFDDWNNNVVSNKYSKTWREIIPILQFWNNFARFRKTEDSETTSNNIKIVNTPSKSLKCDETGKRQKWKCLT